MLMLYHRFRKKSITTSVIVVDLRIDLSKKSGIIKMLMPPVIPIATGSIPTGVMLEIRCRSNE